MIAERQRELASDDAAVNARRVDFLVTAAERFIEESEFAFLFDRQRQLFTIGYNVTDGRRDASCYDTLASEARLGSFLAIATRNVAQEHWFKMSRAMTPVGHQRALISWSASMFEYPMPLLVMRTYPHTPGRNDEAVIDRQIEHAREMGVPWGISESGTTTGLFGELPVLRVRGAGTRIEAWPEGRSRDCALCHDAGRTAASTRSGGESGAADHRRRLGPLGFYESIDYTKDRMPPGWTGGGVVKTYMAHHHAMSCWRSITA
jgi:hypothetical protein